MQRRALHFSQRVMVALILQNLQWPCLSHFTGQCATWSTRTSPGTPTQTLLGGGGGGGGGDEALTDAFVTLVTL